MRLKQISKNKKQEMNPYKIRQIIIKVMECTHIPIHQWAKSTQSNKNKVQQINVANKGNKKLYLPIRTKLTKAQTGKQN